MPLSSAQLAERLHACGVEIARIGTELAARGWTPATSSNFSMRIDEETIAVTVSGRDKRVLSADDVMAVDLGGQPVGRGGRPSAETNLHLQIYRRCPGTGAVLHTHSRNQTVASRLFAHEGAIALEGWELQKALTGYTSHDSRLDVPVFPNSQDMADIEQDVAAWLDVGKPLYAYLIEGHGLYTWGRDMPEARRHLEALEFLLACELDLKRLGGTR
ncbi:MAG TPA: methylthioribulose 1-phosphate dehydratase [Rhodanobacteraceae bacterium]|jgi:methylthioribulose-1-phosphate dehydratase|nr:methylthioribulose 1-phosphate dehydratase [Rhodanobacteraceae bacterium]